MATTANVIRLYLRHRPQLYSIVSQGLCNYSALARKLQKEIFPSKKDTFPAIKAALLRLARSSREKGGEIESRVEKVLGASTVEVRSDVCVVSSSSGIGVPVIATSTSKSGVMSVVDSSYAKMLRKKGFDIKESLTLITICSPKELQTTPGCASVILNAIASEGINVLEFISCHNDTLIVVRNSDAVRVYGLLQDLISKSRG